MKSLLTLLLAAFSAVAVAQGEVDKTVEQTAESVKPAFHNMQKNNDGNIPTTFLHQPPLVPHSIRGLQVTKNANQCLGCHSPEAAPTTGATQIPDSHFLDREGKRSESSSPRRYFCLQCHVQQADVDPIIQNKFDTLKQGQVGQKN